MVPVMTDRSPEFKQAADRAITDLGRSDTDAFVAVVIKEDGEATIVIQGMCGHMVTKIARDLLIFACEQFDEEADDEENEESHHTH